MNIKELEKFDGEWVHLKSVSDGSDGSTAGMWDEVGRLKVKKDEKKIYLYHDSYYPTPSGHVIDVFRPSHIYYIEEADPDKEY